MAKELMSPERLRIELMAMVRKTEGCESVMDVTILPSETPNQNWEPAFVRDGPGVTPHRAFQCAMALQGRYDCDFG